MTDLAQPCPESFDILSRRFFPATLLILSVLIQGLIISPSMRKNGILSRDNNTEKFLENLSMYIDHAHVNDQSTRYLVRSGGRCSKMGSVAFTRCN